MDDEGRWYPDVDDILTIHEDIVAEYPETEPGVKDSGSLEYTVSHLQEGRFTSEEPTIHEEAFQLLRLLVANHPFVDANKRTALDTVATFYLLNGYELEVDDEIRHHLRRLATSEETVDQEEMQSYLESHTAPTDLQTVVDEWREELISGGIERLEEERDG